MNRSVHFIRDPDLAFVVTYLVLFTLLLISIASISLLVVIKEQSNPFFYATF